MISPFPGFASPAAGFEQPFEMLEACHERLRRSLALLDRLIRHIDEGGHDTSSRAAAGDVLRYFDLAAPAHHLDEERHVFPLLLAQGDAAAASTVHELVRDHQRFVALWALLRGPLAAWAGGDKAAVSAATRESAAEFLALHATHLQREDELVFPVAMKLADAETQARMGAEMQARRRAPASRG